MKSILKVCILLFAVCSLQQSKAQISVSINLNVQPEWGPTGYNYVDYYYLPEIDAYYYVPQRQFIFLEGNRWVFYNQPPPRYRNFDFYRTYKVVINEPKPYLHHDVYYNKYITYKTYYSKQPAIRDHSREPNRNNDHGPQNHPGPAHNEHPQPHAVPNNHHDPQNHPGPAHNEHPQPHAVPNNHPDPGINHGPQNNPGLGHNDHPQPPHANPNSNGNNHAATPKHANNGAPHQHNNGNANKQHVNNGGGHENAKKEGGGKGH
jgi:hypothetical protein